MKRLSIGLALLLGLLGCGTNVHYTQLNQPPHAMTPKPPDQVAVFMTSAPSQPFVEVALLEARQQSEYSVDHQTQILEKLKKEAGRRGCDGIILTGSADKVMGSSNFSTTSSTTYQSNTIHTLQGYRAMCIVYVEQPASAKEPSRDPITESAAKQL